jgi:hypothetical protein
MNFTPAATRATRANIRNSSYFDLAGVILLERGCVRRNLERLASGDCAQILLRPEVAHRAVTGKTEFGPVHSNAPRRLPFDARAPSYMA